MGPEAPSADPVDGVGLAAGGASGRREKPAAPPVVVVAAVPCIARSNASSTALPPAAPAAVRERGTAGPAEGISGVADTPIAAAGTAATGATATASIADAIAVFLRVGAGDFFLAAEAAPTRVALAGGA